MVRICQILFFLNILYCLLAMTHPGFPAWKMFEQVDRIHFSLKNAQTNAIDIYDHLMPAYYMNRQSVVREAISFYCKKERKNGPFELALPDQNLNFKIGGLNHTCHVPL